MSDITWQKIRKWFLTAGTVFLFLALILQPEITAAAIMDAMENFCTQLVPVLFPYMVLSRFFCTYGLLDPLAVLLPVNRLFRMHNGAFSVFLMGHLCGYPIGAEMAGNLVRQGKLNRRQGEILCAVSSGASPAFLLHMVGGYLWGDVRFGGFLLMLQILMGLAAGTVLGRTAADVSDTPEPSEGNVPFVQCFCEAVNGSAGKLVSIGGYIVFFSLFVHLLPGTDLMRSAAAAVLEFSSGTRTAAALGGMAGLFLTGFSVGFGGLSVMAQNTHMLTGSCIRLGTYLRYKLFLGAVCGIGSLFYGILYPACIESPNTSAVLITGGNRVYLCLFFCLLGMMWYAWYAHRESRQ